MKVYEFMNGPKTFFSDHIKKLVVTQGRKLF